MNIWIETSLIIGMTAVAALTDVRYRKVYNKHLLIMIALGLVIFIGSGNFHRLSVIGFALPFAVHYIPFRLGLVSAGDVKLFMVIGLFAGVPFVGACMIISYLVGGVAAIGIMIQKKCFQSKMRNVKNYLITSVLLRKAQTYKSVNHVETAMPFALMIHFAVLIQVFLVR